MDGAVRWQWLQEVEDVYTLIRGVCARQAQYLIIVLPMNSFRILMRLGSVGADIMTQLMNAKSAIW